MIELTQKYKLTKSKTIAITPSTVIADAFNKEHKNVIQSIENLVAENSATKSMFIKSTYENRGKDYKEYLLTRDGYTLLAMGFTGAKALDFKLKYIEAFNLMEDEIKKQQIARVETKVSNKVLNDALKELYGNNLKGHHCSNEVNMLNKIVLGMSSKQYKEVHKIEGDLRDHLEASQLEVLEKLEQYDELLISAGYEYQERKLRCEEYYSKTNKVVA